MRHLRVYRRDGKHRERAHLEGDVCAVMAHRGPDGEGRYLDDGIALGHRRLSLIDLEGGFQPMVRATGERAARVTSPARDANGTRARERGGHGSEGRFRHRVQRVRFHNYRELLSPQTAGRSRRAPIPKCCSPVTSPGERACSTACGACSHSPSGTAPSASSSARATLSASSRSTTVVQSAHGAQVVFASEIKCILEHPAYSRELNEEALEQYTLCSSSPHCRRHSSRESSNSPLPTA